MPHQIVWFEIPVLDLDRAITFYTHIIGAYIEKQEHPGFTIGVFPHRPGYITGCLQKSESDKPSDHGPLLYLNVSGRLDAAIEAARKNGGKVLIEKQQVGVWGYRAVILDSEGNRVALHST